MSVEKKAARGVAWNMLTSVVTRAVQLVGTLLLTRFIAPAEYGAVSAATVCVLTASQLSTFSFGQYLIAHRSPPKVCFQAAITHVLLGAAAMTAVFLLREPLGRFVDAPGMGRLVPGFIVAFMIDRVRMVPERMLVRELRFRAVALVNSAGELTFTGVALATASRLGGGAIVAGSIARSILVAVLFLFTAPRAEWLVPSRLEAPVVRGFFGYGLPIMIASMSDRAASTWDNLLVSRMFGPSILGQYNLSYSLAETPLIYVAERISDVLMPSFSKMEPEERPPAVIRAAAIMSLVVAPLGVGLGAVAPTVVQAFFDERWASMGPILTVLSVMTVFQPAPWAAVAYLQTERKTRPIMVMSLARAVVLLALVLVLGRLGGPLWACVGVGAGYAFHGVLTILVAGRATGLPVVPYLTAMVRPLLACVPMFLAVVVVRSALSLPVAVSLAVQCVVGAVVYVAFAFVFAKHNAMELMTIARGRSKRAA